MHASSRKALFVLLSAAALAATGCSKKPKRPDPSSTLLGQTGTLTPGAPGDFGDPLNNPAPNTDLAGRGDPLDPSIQERGVLQSVYFAYDQSAIPQHERAKLDAAKQYLDANPEKRLLIEGRCDWRGTAEYNLGLGDRRAQAAKQYLVTLGVPETKIEVLSKGDLEAAENASEDIMSKDRRAELVPLKH